MVIIITEKKELSSYLMPYSGQCVNNMSYTHVIIIAVFSPHFYSAKIYVTLVLLMKENDSEKYQYRMAE